LGAASYSLYLVHYPLVAAVARLSVPILPTGIAASLIGGFAYHFLVERHVKAKWNPEVFMVRRWRVQHKEVQQQTRSPKADGVPADEV
jgi:peptidoglycan/LPS O-acetylase OafA/YrhL